MYSNISVSTAYNKELKHKSDELSLYNELKSELEFLEMCLADTSESDQDMVAEINNNILKLEEKVENVNEFKIADKRAFSFKLQK